MAGNVIDALKIARIIGKTQFEQFVAERICDVANKSITDTLYKTVLHRFQVMSQDFSHMESRSLIL